MLPVFQSLRDVTLLSILVRLLLAFFCGGIIGIEREYKRRSAGFRTHILICLGASMTTLTGQYLCLYLHYSTDMARLGAQVVAGIGFIGAGAIITTQRRQVKGLTTSAGLWASGIIGLCLGAGFYEGGLAATILILAAEIIFSRFEYWMKNHAPEITLYIEYAQKSILENIMARLREKQISVITLESGRTTGDPAEDTGRSMCAVLTLQLKNGISANKLMDMLGLIPGVSSVEEL